MKLNMNSYEMEYKDPKIKGGKFINRELSWIDFNSRVLYYAMDSKTPLNERFNFLSITDSNLNEFLSVRLSYAKKNKDTQPVKEILSKSKKFIESQNKAYNILKLELKKEGMEITKLSKLNKKEYRKMETVFMNNIFPLLTPISIETVDDYRTLENGQICIACLINDRGRDVLNIIPVSKFLDRCYTLNNKSIILIEDMIMTFINNIFINKKVIHKTFFKIIKDGDIELAHDTNTFIVDRMEESITKRSLSKPIFMIISKDCNHELKEILSHCFNLGNKYIVDSTMVDYTRFSKEPPLQKSSNYNYKPFEPAQYDITESHYSIYNILNSKDVLLHHPYDSYDMVLKFINHAAVDPDVLAIKQTLYRVSSDQSPIINSLCKAAKNGKHVVVLIEIKARFDEENNIRLIRKLKESGVIVILGPEYLKTHCKMCVVIRRSEDGSHKIYSHIGTGNYNEKTAKLYTDISYLTSKQKIGMDLINIFNIVSGNSAPDTKLNKVLYSPVTLRKSLIKMIDREIDHAKKKKKAEIFLKVNSLSDKMIVNKLYEAASAGVKVYVLSRGVCSITPKDNIYIKSIVGRFLEHSRIYYFYNNKNPEYLIGSADLLTRNLDKRVETLVSLKDTNVVNKLEHIIKILKNDEKCSFVMQKNGEYIKKKGDFDCHDYFINNSKYMINYKKK